MWLSNTSEKSVRLYVGFPGSEWSPRFLDQDVDVVSLANKGIVIGCFVGRNYNKILMETFSRSKYTNIQIYAPIFCQSKRIYEIKSNMKFDEHIYRYIYIDSTYCIIYIYYVHSENIRVSLICTPYVALNGP